MLNYKRLWSLIFLLCIHVYAFLFYNKYLGNHEKIAVFIWFMTLWLSPPFPQLKLLDYYIHLCSSISPSQSFEHVTSPLLYLHVMTWVIKYLHVLLPNHTMYTNVLTCTQRPPQHKMSWRKALWDICPSCWGVWRCISPSHPQTTVQLTRYQWRVRKHPYQCQRLIH